MHARTVLFFHHFFAHDLEGANFNVESSNWDLFISKHDRWKRGYEKLFPALAPIRLVPNKHHRELLFFCWPQSGPGSSRAEFKLFLRTRITHPKGHNIHSKNTYRTLIGLQIDPNWDKESILIGIRNRGSKFIKIEVQISSKWRFQSHQNRCSNVIEIEVQMSSKSRFKFHQNRGTNVIKIEVQISSKSRFKFHQNRCTNVIEIEVHIS